VTLTTSLSDSDHGTYTVEVSPGQDVAQNGLEYWLSVRIEKSGATARWRPSVAHVVAHSLRRAANRAAIRLLASALSGSAP